MSPGPPLKKEFCQISIVSRWHCSYKCPYFEMNQGTMSDRVPHRFSFFFFGESVSHGNVYFKLGVSYSA